jgi:radical SAM family uncharacterized protein
MSPQLLLPKYENRFSKHRGPIYQLEMVGTGLRLYEGMLTNVLGLKHPLLCGFKLTYNCNLRCKMCPFWRKESKDFDAEHIGRVLRKIRDAGVCMIAFEGGEPLLRRDLPIILQTSRSVGLHTSLVTNGMLLKSRIDEIAHYINGVIYVSIDGLEKTHDRIRGVSGCFQRAVDGIKASKNKVSVTINVTLQQENLREIEDLVKMASELGVGISFATAHEYCNSDTNAPESSEFEKVICRVIDMKRQGYSIVNSFSYFEVLLKRKILRCQPWVLMNVDPLGNLVLPCYVRNDYLADVPIWDVDVRRLWKKYDWKAIDGCCRCTLHCYVEPSLVLSGEIEAYLNWAARAKV